MYITLHGICRQGTLYFGYVSETIISEPAGGQLYTTLGRCLSACIVSTTVDKSISAVLHVSHHHLLERGEGAADRSLCKAAEHSAVRSDRFGKALVATGGINATTCWQRTIPTRVPTMVEGEIRALIRYSRHQQIESA